MLKLATILFADVVDSTAHAETLDPEVVHEHMSDFFDTMVSQILLEGGTIEKFIGDAIMAVFGVPLSHEDDPLRAIRAARAMLSELETWNEVRDEHQRFRLRIGINTGRVLAAGRPGDDLLVTGDPVNVAARLQAIAAPGSIVVGERTAKAASSAYVMTPLGPQFLRGRTEPVAAFEVQRQKSQDDVPVSYRAPLIGRETELQLVGTLFKRLLDQQEPHLVLLTGDAGVGKSRLALEVSQRLEAEGAHMLVGRCLAYGQGQTLAPLAEILRRATGTLSTDAPRSVMSKIEALVAETSPGTPAQVKLSAAALAVTLGLHHDDDPLEETDPREVYRLLSNSWRSLLSGLARANPLLVVIEDLHWADDVLRQLIAELVERTLGPLLFLCTARPESMRGSSFSMDVPNLVTFPLQPLDENERTAMATSLLGDEHLPQGLRSLVERSEGNPFFLEEIIRHLTERELLQRSDDGWVLLADPGVIELPDNVEGVIVSRLDALDPFDKQVLQQAAVVGRLFWPGAVAAALQVQELEESLRNLERRQLIIERLTSSIEGETEYIFKHALIRDVAYEGLPRGARGSAHARIAEWLMQKAGERFEEAAESLAHHFVLAFDLLGDEELRVRARDMSMRAAAQAAQRFSLQQAARSGSDAVALSRGGERREALEALGDVQNPHSGDAAWQAYLEALQDTDTSDELSAADIARLAAKASVVATRWQGMMEAAPAADEVRSVIEVGLRHAPGEDRAQCLLLSARTWAQIQGYEERDEGGRQAAAEALAIARRLDDPDLISSILDATSLWELTERRFGNMSRIIDERLALVPRLTDVTEVCDVYAMAAWNATFIGRYPIAVAHATECVERAQGVDVGAFQHGLVWRASARFMAGDWDGCLRDQEQIERVQSEDARELPPPYVMRPYAFAALCHELRGEREEADRYLRVLRRFHADRDMPVNLIGSRAPMCRALAHRGELDEALSLLRLEPSQFLCIHLEAWTDVMAGVERWDEASELLPKARAEAERGELIALGYFLDRLEGRVAAAGADIRAGRRLLRQSAEGFERLGAPWEAAYSLLQLAAISDRSDVGHVLDKAASTFDVLGSVAELQACARLRNELGSPIA